MNTAFFIIPMIPLLMQKAYRHPEELAHLRAEAREWINRRFARYKGAARRKSSYSESPYSHARRQSAGASRERLLGGAVESSRALSAKSYFDSTDTSGRLSLSETAKLSLEFCILWFFANYSIIACLEYTTVASSTILVSTCSVFTLIFGVITGVERFTLRKLIGVLASLAGVILVSSADLSGNSSDDEHRGDFPRKSLRQIAVGDGLALLSAVLYGVYSVFMKKRIPSEDQVSMPLFFGLVGLINVVLLWPGFLLLSWTGIEPFELPPTGRVTLILVSNSAFSLVADLAWAYAVVMTSPLVVTVGLSMTIPLSLIGQILLNSQTASVVYWIGAVMVVVSFVFVSHEEKPEIDVAALVDDQTSPQRRPVD